MTDAEIAAERERDRKRARKRRLEVRVCSRERMRSEALC
jgi:hypothetical protein